MILLFDNTCSKEQVDNPQWVWQNWDKAEVCMNYYEALHLNAIMYSSEGFITPMITVEVAIRSGWV